MNPLDPRGPRPAIRHLAIGRPAASPAAASHAAGRGLAIRRFALRSRMFARETGAATAEYAIATLAAVGFAGLLVVILRSDAVRGMLMDLVQRALSIGG